MILFQKAICAPAGQVIFVNVRFVVIVATAQESIAKFKISTLIVLGVGSRLTHPLAVHPLSSDCTVNEVYPIHEPFTAGAYLSNPLVISATVIN